VLNPCRRIVPSVNPSVRGSTKWLKHFRFHFTHFIFPATQHSLWTLIRWTPFTVIHCHRDDGLPPRRRFATRDLRGRTLSSRNRYWGCPVRLDRHGVAAAIVLLLRHWRRKFRWVGFDSLLFAISSLYY